jgi:hypothetical protein
MHFSRNVLDRGFGSSHKAGYAIVCVKLEKRIYSVKIFVDNQWVIDELAVALAG